MTYSIVNLEQFYSTPLGQATSHHIRACICEIWKNLDGQSLLGMGYAMPYLDFYEKPSTSVFAFIPAIPGIASWPDSRHSCLAVVEEDYIPLPDESIDNILVVHGLEYAQHTQKMLREVWRVLKSSGRLLIIVPNRRSMWAHLDTTPFGYGQPYTMTQLIHTLERSLFTPVVFRRTLYTIPSHSRWITAFQPFLDKAGSNILQKFSGVVCVESIKQVCAGTPLPVKNTRLVPQYA